MQAGTRKLANSLGLMGGREIPRPKRAVPAPALLTPRSAIRAIGARALSLSRPEG